MRRSVVLLLAAAALSAGACGSNASSDSATGEGTETSTTGATPGTASFGDLPSDLCGDGEFSVDAAEAGTGSDKLYIGVANDRTAEVAPGLFKVNYDTSVAFA